MADQAPVILVPGSPNKLKRMPAADTLPLSNLRITSGVPVGTTMTQTLTNKTLTSPKVNALVSSVDSTDSVAEILGVASAVNHLILQNNVTGQNPRISATGTDANIGLTLNTKGTGLAAVRYAGVLHTIVDTDTAQSLALKALVAPSILDYSNANHTHASTAQGGLLDARTVFAAGTGIPRVLYRNTASSAAIANTTTETAFDVSAYATTFNTFAAVGQVVRLTFCGKFSNTGTPTILFRLRGSTGPINLVATAAITTPAGVTDELWSLQILMVVRAIGAGGSLFFTVPRPTVAGTAEARQVGAATAYDFVANGATATNLQLTATWSAASASNTIVLEQVLLEALN